MGGPAYLIYDQTAPCSPLAMAVILRSIAHRALPCSTPLKRKRQPTMCRCPSCERAKKSMSMIVMQMNGLDCIRSAAVSLEVIAIPLRCRAAHGTPLDHHKITIPFQWTIRCLIDFVTLQLLALLEVCPSRRLELTDMLQLQDAR